MSAAHRREVIDDHMNDSNWMKLTRITTLLIRKWKRACRESQPATAAFEELNAAPDPEKRVEWEREAEAAEAERDATPSVMDIYDVSTTPLPTRKDVQVMLAQEELNEGADGDLLGAADWIATGLRVEETKIAVAHTARHVKATSGSQTRLSLVQQRQCLASAIAAFHKAGKRHMPNCLPGDGGHIAADLTHFGAEWDEREDADAEAVPDLPADTPEVHPIGLPSTFGIEFLAQMNMLELAKKERQLREGQLNDALQGIRTGIGYKSLLYRSKVRNASSYRAKLRSFDDVHVADEGVRKHVRVYQHSRQVMERLFDPDDPEDVRGLAEFRTRYREIRKEDLRVSTAVLESFTLGLRNEHSAWFWNISDTRAGEETQWIQDYRRMLWLRAYARKARWDEEIVLVPFEMDCTIRSFEKRAADWEKWMGISPTPGHTAFAQRQNYQLDDVPQDAETDVISDLHFLGAHNSDLARTILMARHEPSSADDAELQKALISGRLEVLLVIWRIREALQALPRAPDSLAVRRWNHGIARELWLAITAVGFAAATEMTLDRDNGAADLRCKPLVYLLRAAVWESRRLRVNVMDIDIPTYISLSDMDTGVFHGLEDSLVFPKWWTWLSDGPGEETKHPGWWINPTVDVGAPMPVFESDKDDLSATAGQLYTHFGRLAAEKEADLRAIDGRIAEEELEFSR
ncbi:hypothetical protein LXA43DRAFT_1105133 [Ganoderma leucocontextum]|nr:hypothetical protein LXA43DRAFT_1105133 [Ganoderma leucocontextum]